MIRAAIYGRLGGNPVERATRSAKAMVTVSVAVNVAKPDEEPATEWFSIVAFGTVAESLARLVKGDLISVMGSLTKSSFTGRDGQERSSWSLVAEAILSARAVRNERPRERGSSPRVRRAQHGRQASHAGPPIHDDRVDDLWQRDLVP